MKLHVLLLCTPLVKLYRALCIFTMACKVIINTHVIVLSSTVAAVTLLKVKE